MSLIELKDVTKDFKIGKEQVNIIKPTNLSIEMGEFVAIVGPSGSGKSTLLTIIGALQTPTDGTIMINEKDISTLNSKMLSLLRFDEVGFILQGSNLVPYLTIEQQFKLKYKYSKQKIDHERIDFIFEKLSINHLKHKYPEDISGGERQRAAIGASLLLGPKIILADEPTASLDTKKAFEVFEILKDVSHKQNTTIIVVTHDTRLLSYCDRVLEINDGILIEVSIDK